MSASGLRAENTDWLRRAIQTSELGAGSVLTAVELDSFVGTGQMSRNARFNLTWADKKGPASVIVKMPSLDQATMAWSAATGLYARECYFYDALAPLTPMDVPRVFVNEIDEPSGDFVLAMEDRRTAEQGDQFTEPGDNELSLAVAQAAALHAPFWDRMDLPVLQPLMTAADERAAFMKGNIAECLPICLERLGDQLEDGIGEVVSAFGSRVGDWIQNADAVRTIVHGDFRPDNFLWDRASSERPLTIVDWQTYHLGAGVNDIGYLLGGALTAERRRTVEDALLDEYVGHLGNHGISYPVETCRHDYARGALYGLIVAIAATARAARTERGDALFTLMLNRHGQHALDLDALSLM